MDKVFFTPTKGVSIQRHCLCWFVTLLLLMGCASSSGERAASEFVAPFSTPWDIRPANSTLTVNFKVKSYKNYHIYIGFNKKNATFQDINALNEFVGPGGYRIVTRDAIPQAVHAKGMEEVQRTAELLLQGVYTTIPINPGKILPVQIALFQLQGERSSSEKQLINEIIDTKFKQFGADRAITTVALKPGVYRIELKTLQETTLPKSVQPFLCIAAHPKAAELTDKP